MSDLTKAWVATEGLKRAEHIVQQLAEDGAANNNIIGAMLQHRMREMIGRAIDIALEEGAAGNGKLVVYPGQVETHYLDGTQVVEDLAAGTIEITPAVPKVKRGRRKGTRNKKPAAGAEA